MTPATRTELFSAAALTAIIAVVLASAGPALDHWLSQSQTADLAAAQQRQQQAEDRALARLRRQLQADCGNGTPIVQAQLLGQLGQPGQPFHCTTRSPRGR